MEKPFSSTQFHGLRESDKSVFIFNMLKEQSNEKIRSPDTLK